MVCLVALVFVQDGDSALDGVVQDALHLKLVLVVGVPLREVAKLLGQVEAVADVFRRDEVLGNLDAVVEISDLDIKMTIKRLTSRVLIELNRCSK